MYYSISGKLLDKSPALTVIEAGGVGYEIQIPQTTFQELPEVGENVRLFVHLIVRENDMSMVGFLRIEDRKLYQNLILVSGIGPKQGLRILSDLSASQIRNAIISGDSSLLSRVKGIGTKTASRLILELKDKMKHLEIVPDDIAQGEMGKKKTEVLLALRVLGYNDAEARRCIDKAFEVEDFSSASVEEIIKKVLAYFSG